jgi:hypothetical protein
VSVREYAVLYLGAKGGIGGATAGGGNALLTTGTHALGGPEHSGQLPADRVSLDPAVLGQAEAQAALMALEAAAGGRPPYSYVLAATDTPAALQALADVVCDGTADQTEINAAISAVAGEAEPGSILLLPGTYSITGEIDFTPVASHSATGARILFEATNAKIVAGGNLTNMVNLGPTTGNQIVACLTVRIGALEGLKATYTVTQGVYLRRFSDNHLWIGNINGMSGIGVTVDQAGVSDYGCFNNFIEILRIGECTSHGIAITSGSNVYGFQGNQVRTGQIIANASGIVVGDTVNENASYNTFICSPIEHNAQYGVYDRCGGNTWFINNTNSNGIAGVSCPTGMTKRSSFILTADDTIDAAVLDQHYVLDYGRQRGTIDIAEHASAPATPGSGYGRIYFKSDGKAYAKNDAGTEYDLTGAGVTDHGALTGLGDDDHTQYLLRSVLTTRGDLYRRGAAAIERVALGASGTRLRSDGTDPVWSALRWEPMVTYDGLVMLDSAGNPHMHEVSD